MRPVNWSTLFGVARRQKEVDAGTLADEVGGWEILEHFGGDTIVPAARNHVAGKRFIVVEGIANRPCRAR